MTIYKNNLGKRLAGVTTIIKNLGWNTDALVGWARREAMSGEDPEKIKQKAAEIGTLAHYLCECDAKGETPNLDDYSKNAYKVAKECFDGYLDWKKTHNINEIQSEIKLVSEKWQCGGTIDMLYKSGDKIILGDIKTSNNIFTEHKVQIAAYKSILEENGYKVDDVYVLHLDKEGGFTSYKVGNLDVYLQIFEHCLALNNLKKIC